MSKPHEQSDPRRSVILDASGQRATLSLRRNGDDYVVAGLPLKAGERLTRVLAGALGGGLLVGTATSILYGWGRGYYEGFLRTFGLPASSMSAPLPDVLFAPLNTVFATLARIGLALIGLGVVGVLAMATRILAPVIAHRLLQARWRLLPRLIRGFIRPSHRPQTTDEASDEETFRSATRLVLAGLLLFLGGMAVALGGIAASRDGEAAGRRALDACEAGTAGTLAGGWGEPVGNYCARIGDDVITYVPGSRSVQVEKWDKQRLRVVRPKPKQ